MHEYWEVPTRVHTRRKGVNVRDPLAVALREVLIEFKLACEMRDRMPTRRAWPEHTDIYEAAVEKIRKLTQDDTALQAYLQERLGA